MRTWFMCKVKYSKEEEDGRLKSVTEPYLVDAMSFTEAEARIYEELGSIIKGEFLVTSITKTKIVDVFHYDDIDIWHRAKVTYMVSDDSGKEKKVSQQMLVSAHDVKQAYDRIYESLGTMLVTFRVPEVIETPIMEIFPYIPEEDRPVQIPDNLKPVSEVGLPGGVKVDEDGVIVEEEETVAPAPVAAPPAAVYEAPEEEETEEPANAEELPQPEEEITETGEEPTPNEEPQA